MFYFSKSKKKLKLFIPIYCSISSKLMLYLRCFCVGPAKHPWFCFSFNWKILVCLCTVNVSILFSSKTYFLFCYRFRFVSISNQFDTDLWSLTFLLQTICFTLSSQFVLGTDPLNTVGLICSTLSIACLFVETDPRTHLFHPLASLFVGTDPINTDLFQPLYRQFVLGTDPLNMICSNSLASLFVETDPLNTDLFQPL